MWWVQWKTMVSWKERTKHVPKVSQDLNWVDFSPREGSHSQPWEELPQGVGSQYVKGEKVGQEA